MPLTSLEDLPTELVETILCMLASPTALRCLIQASPQCYRIFLRSKSDLLHTTLSGALRPEIKSLVLLVHEAYSLPTFDGNALDLVYRQGRTSQNAFVTKFSQSREVDGQVSYLPTPHVVVPQLRTISTMEYLVEDYCNWVSHHLHFLRSCLIKQANPLGMLPPPQAHHNLSPVEQFRLQRAFLCFEIFCTVMHSVGGHDREAAAKHDVRETNNQFLDILQPWEREELVCIFDYLTVRLEDLFDKLELDYVERMTEQFLSGEIEQRMPTKNASSNEAVERSSMSDLSTSIPGGQDATLPDYETNGGQPQAQIDHTTDFFTAKTKTTLHASYVAHLLTLGLPFLRRLFQSPTKEQRRLIFDNLSSQGEMAKLVTGKWINRDQAQLLRRHGADENGAATRRRLWQLVAAGVITNPTTAAGVAPTPNTTLAAPGATAVAGGMPTPNNNHQPTTASQPTTSDHERILTFEGDRLGKPNYAFLWTHGFTSDNVCSGCDYLHRDLGYVFWDHGRVRAMELVEEGHGSTGGRRRRQGLRLRRSTRAEEKSAQARLADMGFVIVGA